MGLQNKSELAELAQSWEQALKLAEPIDNPEGAANSKHGSNLVQNLSTLLAHAGRPNLLATGLVAILKDADCATGAVAVARDENGVCEELASFGTIEPGAVTRTLTLGTPAIGPSKCASPRCRTSNRRRR